MANSSPLQKPRCRPLSLGGLSLRDLAVRTWKRIEQNELMTRAAAVAFYAMLALVPFLALVLAITIDLLPDLSGPSGVDAGIANMTVGELRQTLKGLFPSDAYGVIEAQVTRLQRQPKAGLISISLAITLWLASSLFVAITDAMNRIYGFAETRPFWKLRLIAMVMTVVQAAILIAALFGIVAWPELMAWLGVRRSLLPLVTAVRWIIVTVMVLLSFALSFYVGPASKPCWSWITPGGLAGTAVFLAASYAFRVYVQNFTNYDATYGSLGGVMVLMSWFWISCFVLMIAAQINKEIEDATFAEQPLAPQKVPHPTGVTRS
jgi:membrane protein